MTTNLIDATGTPAAETIEIRVEVRFVKTVPSDHQWLYQDRPLTERPTNAKLRREHAASVFAYRWRYQEDATEMIEWLEQMRKLGPRSVRWQTAITSCKNKIRNGCDLNWATLQFPINLNYAA